MPRHETCCVQCWRSGRISSWSRCWSYRTGADRSCSSRPARVLDGTALRPARLGDGRPVTDGRRSLDDRAIKQIRSAIFGLSTMSRLGRGIRDRTLALLDESAAVLGFEPRVFFDGPVEAAVTEPVAADLLATLREALTNVARHANAARVDVTLTAGAEVVLTVADDGVGTPQPVTTQGRGLGNMAARATRHHSTMRIDPAPSGGTMVTWRIPAPHRRRSPVAEVAGDDEHRSR